MQHAAVRESLESCSVCSSPTQAQVRGSAASYAWCAARVASLHGNRDMRWVERLQKLSRIERLASGDDAPLLGPTCHNTLACIRDNWCAYRVDVPSPRRRVAFLRSFACDHVYKEGLRRTPSVVGCYWRSCFRVVDVPEWLANRRLRDMLGCA